MPTRKARIDRLYVAYNKFINTMTQQPVLEQLIPVQGREDKELESHWDYIYEPDSKPVMDALMIRYIESLVYQGVVDNLACEQAARMVAMKSATDNADRPDRRAAADLQQGAPGRHYPGDLRDRRRCGRGLIAGRTDFKSVPGQNIS